MLHVWCENTLTALGDAQLAHDSTERSGGERIRATTAGPDAALA